MLLQAFGFLHLTFVDILDIICVGLIIFFVFRWMKGSSGMSIFIAIVILFLLRVIVGAVGMKMMSGILKGIIDVGFVALIVIFQPEIRRFLFNVGRHAGRTFEKRSLFERFLNIRPVKNLSSTSAKEICEACYAMSEQKTGALIVILHNSLLTDVTSTGDAIDATISHRLIMNIFYKNSPLHDGAMIIRADRIVAARCTLPISDSLDLPANFGMRHKSALGVSEISDADVIVVSEQTGQISHVCNGVITKIDNIASLMLVLDGGEKK